MSEYSILSFVMIIFPVIIGIILLKRLKKGKITVSVKFLSKLLMIWLIIITITLYSSVILVIYLIGIERFLEITNSKIALAYFLFNLLSFTISMGYSINLYKKIREKCRERGNEKS